MNRKLLTPKKLWLFIEKSATGIAEPDNTICVLEWSRTWRPWIRDEEEEEEEEEEKRIRAELLINYRYVCLGRYASAKVKPSVWAWLQRYSVLPCLADTDFAPCLDYIFTTAKNPIIEHCIINAKNYSMTYTKVIPRLSFVDLIDS